jgi:hypothetical protein
MRIAGKIVGGRPIVLGLVVLLIFSGCSEEDDNPSVPGHEANIPNTSLTFPDTPRKLMTNFQTIYETRDAKEYKLTLDPAFVTLLQQFTIDEFPQVGPELDATEETWIHDRMFSGEVLANANGDLVPPVLHISFSVFEQIVDWGLSLPSDPIPNTLSSLFEVEILVDRGRQYSTLRVEGQIRFYVTTAEGRLNGQPQTYFRLVGQLDLSDNGKDVSRIAWGSLKALFH